MTGEKDFSLESFIVTGAVARNLREDPQGWGQMTGVYASFNPKDAMGFASPTLRRDNKYGAGSKMLVTFNGEIDPANWELDHEMSYEYSLALLKRMSGLLKHLETGHIYEGKGMFGPEKIEFLSVSDQGDALRIIYRYDRDADRLYERDILWENKTPYGENVDDVFFLDKVHDIFKRSFPDEYTAAKAAIIADMASKKTGCLKYVGHSPLRVDKIYTREADAPRAKDNATHEELFSGWSLIHETTAQSLQPSEKKAPPAPKPPSKTIGGRLKRLWIRTP